MNPGAPPLRLGALPLGAARWQFTVWAPRAQRVELALDPGRRVSMQRLAEPLPRLAPSPDPELAATEPAEGYWTVSVDGLAEGSRYAYVLDGGDPLADPASRSQPAGVAGPSALYAPRAPALAQPSVRARDLVIYELHVGTFTDDGTLDAAAARLDELVELGVTAVEPLPLAEFPGRRNWGYDGVFPFAVASAYGGPAALARFVAACHERGLLVVLDVVYNHLGPEGNVLPSFGPYFTDRYRTPWGAALNYDGAHSDGVRRYFVENALYWLFTMGVDALRLDAVHSIADESERPFLAELGAAVAHWCERLGERRALHAESARNTRQYLRPLEQGGCGFDAQWCDDFHHALHVALTGERHGYYVDFEPTDLAPALRHGFVYRGQRSTFRRRRHGVSSRGLDGSRFVVCAQNHDQVGNRALGERLGALVGFESLKLAAGVLLLSPFVPLLFMGEEDGETAPFLYFVDHRDPALLRAVREGREQEHAGFAAGTVPDPGAETTFLRSRRRRPGPDEERRRRLRALYRRLLEVRRAHPALGAGPLERVATRVDGHVVVLAREAGEARVLALFCFADAPAQLDVADAPISGAGLLLLLDSAAAEWGGAGSRAPDPIPATGAVVLPAPGFLLYATPTPASAPAEARHSS